jgi:hypothetical protein
MAQMNFSVPYSFWQKLSNSRKSFLLAIPIVTLFVFVWYANTYFQERQNIQSRAASSVINVANYGSLQKAIDAAASGSTLEVPAGTYNSIEITKPLTLIGQPGAIIDGGNIGVYIKSSNVTVQGFTVQGFDFTGIYCNGTFSNLTVRNVNVNGGNKAVFGIHFQNDTGGYVTGVTITDSKFLGFTSSSNYNYPAHGVYMKVVKNLTMNNVEAGQTAGVGTHSGIDLDDVDTGVIENSVGHNSVVGIAVNQYPSVGNKNLTFRNSGGYSNSKVDLFEYGTNTNIVWESSCYGKYQGPNGSTTFLASSPKLTSTPTPLPISNILNVKDFGAKGDGVTDDRQAIQNTINAAVNGDIVYIPTGKYKVIVNSDTTAIALKSNLTVKGDGIGSVLYAPNLTTPNTQENGYIFFGNNLSNLVIEGLAFKSDYASGPANTLGVDRPGGQRILAIYENGGSNNRLSYLYGENLNYMFKLGGNNPSTRWTINDITVRHSRVGIFMAYISNSSLSRIDFEGIGKEGNSWDHNIYISDNVIDTTFNDLTLTNTSGQNIQTDFSDATIYTGRLVFRRVLADARNTTGYGRPFAIVGDANQQADNLQFFDVKMLGAGNGDVANVMLWSVTNISFDGFESEGMPYLVRQQDNTNAQNITFRNGNHIGNRLNYGNSTTSNLVFDNVTLNNTAHVVTPPELPRPYPGFSAIINPTSSPKPTSVPTLRPTITPTSKPTVTTTTTLPVVTTTKTTTTTKPIITTTTTRPTTSTIATTTTTINNIKTFSSIYEAEDTSYSGPLFMRNHNGFTGTGFIDFQNRYNDYIEWNLTVPTTGSYLLSFRYANSSWWNRPLQVKVNGITVNTGLSFPAKRWWNTWNYSQFFTYLAAGQNTIRLTAIGFNGPNIDHLKVSSN